MKRDCLEIMSATLRIPARDDKKVASARASHGSLDPVGALLVSTLAFPLFRSSVRILLQYLENRRVRGSVSG
jgi:hypothetical protein